VAPGLAAIIIVMFCALRREPLYWLKSLWAPGIALFLAIALPWYIAVQRANPQFLRVFIFEHNLQRFGTDKYQHGQPFWYYLPVLLLALMPWTFVALLALWDATKDAVKQWRDSNRNTTSEQMGDAFPEFLVLWAFLPILFFTLSRSKLPGYILPAIPACTILTADYLMRLRRRELPKLIVILHAVVCGVLVGVALLLPYVAAQRLDPPAIAKWIAGLLAAACLAFVSLSVLRRGHGMLRLATLAPILLVIWFLERPAATVLDAAYSARPLAQQMDELDREGAPIAVFQARRDIEYGLAFYRNHSVDRYERGEVPKQMHYVVLPSKAVPAMLNTVGERAAYHVASYPAQKLEIYRIAAQ
jgi:4-amino-4-deoxy-L-arabinose transferase-like glycosyltransferase